jgi:uncharacterized OsmC-like protein
MSKQSAVRTYHVDLIRLDESRSLVKARSHTLNLNIKKGDGSAGFNAAETLLAALGNCLLTNINALSEKMHLDISSVRIEVDAERSDDPPILTGIHYKLILESSEPETRLQELHDLCIKWGTVTNTLIQGIQPQGELVIGERSI